MKRFYLFLIAFFLYSAASSQLKINFELQEIPASKDSIDAYFLAGNFNGWNPSDNNFKFLKLDNGKYALNMQLMPGKYEYKITRGNWDKVEVAQNGTGLNNRRLNLQNDTTIKINILAWADDFEKQVPVHTASVHVKLLDSVFPMPQLGKTRKIWIYLPASYGQSNTKYPVIYMHDGQNLFDKLTSGYGEWQIDEFLDKNVNDKKEAIIVGIDHGGVDRLVEYNAYDSKFGKGQGKAYVDFLVYNLKPYIDKNYSTLIDAPNTTIAGSSMGGLISMYAIANHPKVFGKAGIFSPSFWVAKPIENNLKTALPKLKNNKIYFVAGALEGEEMVKDLKTVYQILNPTGQNNNIQLVIKADGEHKEWFWSREFADFYKFIMQ